MFYIDTGNTSIQGVKIEPTPAYHPGMNATGFMFSYYEQHIVISGDTKANYKLEKFLNPYIDYQDTPNFLIFHDFSTWDNVLQNVHAYQLDTDTEYSEDFRKLLTFYHDNKPFTRQWLWVN